MENVQEFKEFLPIMFHEETQGFGHFPFHLFFEGHDGKTTMAALALGNVKPCYQSFHAAMKGGAKRCYMSIDYPANDEITTDYIGVFSFDGEQMDLVAIPYDTKTGERLPEIGFKDSKILLQIMTEFSITVLQDIVEKH